MSSSLHPSQLYIRFDQVAQVFPSFPRKGEAIIDAARRNDLSIFAVKPSLMFLSLEQLRRHLNPYQDRYPPIHWFIKHDQQITTGGLELIMGIETEDATELMQSIRSTHGCTCKGPCSLLDLEHFLERKRIVDP